MAEATDNVTVTNDFIEVNFLGYGFKIYKLEEKHDTVYDFLNSLTTEQVVEHDKKIDTSGRR